MGDSALTRRFEEAFLYANHIHRGQKRKKTLIPYISHLMSVAALVMEDGGDEDEVIAALLHDAVEDQGGRPRLEDIRHRFGERVAEIVEACTDSLEHDKGDWEGRKEKYIEHLKRAPPSVLRVAAADKLHNARSILMDHRKSADEVFSRFNRPKDKTLWYYEQLAEALEKAHPGFLSEELKRVVGKLKQRASASLA